MKPTKDLYMICNEGGQLSQEDFEQTFCRVCKNRDCVRADWAFSSWDKRILTQVDRLLVNPTIASQSESSRWEGVVDLEVFQEPQTIEVWGAPSAVVPDAIIIDAPPEPMTIPETPEPKPITPPQPAPPPSPSPFPDPPLTPGLNQPAPLNTPPKEIFIGGAPSMTPPAPSKDPWAVTETLAVGGKFKMGSR
jgi:hypothetical protein